MPKIAIIDDDPDIVEATTMLLEAKGYIVVSAGNVETGFKLLESEKPDLLILDVMMDEPDDGFYLAMKLRKNNFKTPIIMLTSVSKATGLDFAGSINVPVNEFIEKPVAPAILLERVDYFIKNPGVN